MEPPLPVYSTEDFREYVRRYPVKERESIIYNLNHIDKEDIKRIKYLKGEWKHLKRYRIGDNRIFLAYCKECYNKYRDKFSCSDDHEFCNIKNLEKIVVFSLNLRKKVYKRNLQRI